MPRRGEGDAVRLGDAMRRYVTRLDKGNKLAEAVVAEHWTSVAGPHIAEHTDVRGLRGGELLVAVDSSSWATELSAMSEELKHRVNEQIGKDLVTSIRFTVSQRVEHRAEESRARRDTGRRYGGVRVEPKPLSAEERVAVERSVEAIHDPELRKAALSATLRDLEWKKALEDANSPQDESEGSTGPEMGITP